MKKPAADRESVAPAWWTGRGGAAALVAVGAVLLYQFNIKLAAADHSQSVLTAVILDLLLLVGAFRFLERTLSGRSLRAAAEHSRVIVMALAGITWFFAQRKEPFLASRLMLALVVAIMAMAILGWIDLVGQGLSLLRQAWNERRRGTESPAG